MALKLKFIGVVLLVIFLNLSGALVTKVLALHLSDLAISVLLAILLVIIYSGRFAYWIWAGKRYQLSYLYPFISLTYLFSLLLGYLLFREPVTVQKVLGCGLIVIGVFVVGQSKHRSE